MNYIVNSFGQILVAPTNMTIEDEISASNTEIETKNHARTHILNVGKISSYFTSKNKQKHKDQKIIAEKRLRELCPID